MKFRLEALKDFRNLVRELALGLRNLTFGDNFRSFETSVTISATSSSVIRNQLTTIPSKYMIVDQTGNGLVTRDINNTWTVNNLYLYNHGASEVTITVLFLA